ncbi:MAG TPA: iron-containing alcohol dehydrogenase [Firmicutes bacterium]|nr:iron-containing alcohol dehydrogenase [Bacillota bacterium]
MEFSRFESTRFVVGRGSLEHLAELAATRVAIVTDITAMESNGFLRRVQELINRAGAVYEVVADVRREPHTSDVAGALERVARFAPDCIVALGGGSVIDAAKALWLFYEHPDTTWEAAFRPFAVPPLGRKAYLVAVPSTSGTGSETTFVAVLIDHDRRKRLIMSRELVPRLAIIDPDLADTMPPHVAAHAGMDALTHALEAAVSHLANPMVVATAMSAVQDILTWLPVSVGGGTRSDERRQAREAMHAAASLAGVAIGSASAGLAHAMDQPGPLFGIPHGLVCAILLPHTLRFSSPHPVYAALARRLGHEGDEGELCNALVRRVWELCRAIGIPRGFRDLGVGQKDFECQLPGLVEETMKSGSTRLAPVQPDREQARGILISAYHGRHPLEKGV